LIQARTLARLYPNARGHEILRDYDLVISNSGGTLVVGGLLADMKPGDIADQLFCDKDVRDQIFVSKTFGFLAKWFGFGPRYSTADKFDGIRSNLNRLSPGLADKHLSQLPGHIGREGTDFVFTTFDYDRQRAVYLRSNTDSVANSDPAPRGTTATPTLAEAIHAASTAPVNFFDEPAVMETAPFDQLRFWDGAVGGNNNPVLAGVVEALANGSAPGELYAVSIGTASVMLPLSLDYRTEPPLAIDQESSGIFTDLKKLAKAIVDDPPDASSYVAYRIMHGQNAQGAAPRLVRFNPLIQPMPVNDSGGPPWRYPKTLEPDQDSDDNPFARLVALQLDATAQEDVELIERLCSLWMDGEVMNQPLQTDDRLGCCIGHRIFRHAELAFHPRQSQPQPPPLPTAPAPAPAPAPA